MIGLIFTLFFLMIFMLSVLVMDALIGYQRVRDWVNDHFSHDTHIFPDHES